MKIQNIRLQSDELRSEINRLHQQLSEYHLLEARLKSTLHELHVHQEELRTQNDDLLAAQSEIEAAHRKFVDLFDNAPIGYILIDDQSIIREINLAAAQLLGRARGQVLAKPLWVYLDKRTRDAFQAHLRTLREGRAATIETVFQTPACENTAVELHSIPFENSLSATRSYRIAVLDIRQRRTAEEKLRKTNRWLDSILSTVPDIIYRLDADGRIQYISPTVRRYGYEPDKLIGVKYLSLVSPEQRPAIKQQLAEQLRNREPVRDLEIKLLNNPAHTTPEGGHAHHIFSIHSAVLCEETEHGDTRVLGIQGIAHDITTRKLREQEQRSLKKHLQKGQRLEAIGTLAGGIAHDFNNILTGIQGSVSLLEIPGNTPEKEREYLEIIESCVARGRNLTKQLLGFARGGKYVVTLIDLNSALNSCLKMFNPTQKSIQVINEYDPDLWCVRADGGQMEQVFLNLFINAAHAMPNGGNLKVSTGNRVLDGQAAKRRGVGAGHYVEVTIADSGNGMDDSIRAHIFEPFFSTKPEDSGTGLGLACAYGIIRNHEGTIEVESAPEQGTTFTILLPGRPGETVSPGPDESTRHPLRSHASVLFVDDDDTVCEVVSQMLAALDYTVHTAGSGPAALEAYRAAAPEIDLAILDILMPGMNGIETYAALKEINPDIRVIFCSGYSPDRQVEHLISAENQQFLLKPFNTTELSEMLVRSFNREAGNPDRC